MEHYLTDRFSEFLRIGGQFVREKRISRPNRHRFSAQRQKSPRESKEPHLWVQSSREMEPDRIPAREAEGQHGRVGLLRQAGEVVGPSPFLHPQLTPAPALHLPCGKDEDAAPSLEVDQRSAHTIEVHPSRSRGGVQDLQRQQPIFMHRMDQHRIAKDERIGPGPKGQVRGHHRIHRAIGMIGHNQGRPRAGNVLRKVLRPIDPHLHKVSTGSIRIAVAGRDAGRHRAQPSKSQNLIQPSRQLPASRSTSQEGVFFLECKEGIRVFPSGRIGHADSVREKDFPPQGWKRWLAGFSPPAPRFELTLPSLRIGVDPQAEEALLRAEGDLRLDELAGGLVNDNV